MTYQETMGRALYASNAHKNTAVFLTHLTQRAPFGRATTTKTLRRFCHGRIRRVTHAPKQLGGKAAHSVTHLFLCYMRNTF
jgi:hypothetical protein